jgi:hypothetical protein
MGPPGRGDDEPKNDPKPKRRPGRPEVRTLKIHVTPGDIVLRMFAQAKPPDPTLRRHSPKGG